MANAVSCKSITLLAKDGLHTRPAACFVQEAMKFKSDIVLEALGKSSNAKSLFRLQLLELVQGSEIKIRACGEDANDAVDHLAGYLAGLK